MNNCKYCFKPIKEGRTCSRECEVKYRKLNNIGWHRYSRPEMRI